MEKLKPDSLKKLNDNNDITVKKIILIANKSEYEHDGDIYRDVYKLGFGDPIFVSAEQGDGIQDLLNAIDKSIPEEKKLEYEKTLVHRREKFLKLKEKLKNEILDVQKENNSPEEGFLSFLSKSTKYNKIIIFKNSTLKYGSGSLIKSISTLKKTVT